MGELTFGRAVGASLVGCVLLAVGCASEPSGGVPSVDQDGIGTRIFSGGDSYDPALSQPSSFSGSPPKPPVPTNPSSTQIEHEGWRLTVYTPVGQGSSGVQAKADFTRHGATRADSSASVDKRAGGVALVWTTGTSSCGSYSCYCNTDQDCLDRLADEDNSGAESQEFGYCIQAANDSQKRCWFKATTDTATFSPAWESKGPNPPGTATHSVGQSNTRTVNQIASDASSASGWVTPLNAWLATIGVINVQNVYVSGVGDVPGCGVVGYQDNPEYCARVLSSYVVDSTLSYDR